MRLGLAVFMPARYGLLDGEAPEVVDLMRRIEGAINGGVSVSLEGIREEVKSLPPRLQNSRGLRSIKVWLLWESRQHARALAMINDLIVEWQRELEEPEAVNDPRAQRTTRWLVSARAFEGLLYHACGRHDDSANSFRLSREALRQVTGPGRTTRLLTIDPEEANRLKQLDRSGFAGLLIDSLHLFDNENDSNGVARVANNLGHLYLDLGEPMTARYWFERAVELMEQSPNDMQLSFALDSLGLCYHQIGLAEEARTALEEAFRRASRLGSKALQASLMVTLGHLAADCEQYDTAQELYQQARTLEEQVRNPAGLARIQLALSTLHRRAGQFAMALEAAASAENLLSVQGDPLLRSSATLQALIAAVMLDRPDTVPALRRAVDRLAAVHAKREQALGEWYLAAAAHRSGDRAATFAHLRPALNLGLRHGHLHYLSRELLVTAEMLQPALEQGVCPEATAGLVQRASAGGLATLLDCAPASAPLLAATGRLKEARTLSIRLFGLFQVTRGGGAVDFAATRSQKAISLFKYLLGRRGQLVTREQILETIWPEADPESADPSFQVTLSTLRRLLDLPDGPPVIIRRGRGYMLNSEIPLDIDVDRFARHLQKGDLWWERGQVGLALAEWQQAEACYGGEFLADDPYEDWASTERQRLQEQYVDLLLRLAELALQNGRSAEVIERANRILAVDPVRESAYRLLMRAHAQMGDCAVALRDYQRCAETLQHELGEEPMPETKELAAQIRTGKCREV